MRKILIVEDEPDIAMVLRAYLTKAGYAVRIAVNGDEALHLYRNWRPELVLLDVILPDMQGWSILQSIRRHSSCPVIMLTAMSDVQNRLKGLNGGADDYICKPFIGEEVVARVHTVLRRLPHIVAGETVVFGSLKIDLAAREIWVDGKRVHLTPRDLDLLLHLSAYPNRTFSRDQLLDAVWGIDYDGSDRAVDLSVNRLRQALADWSEQEGSIVTIRRMGYMFRVHS